MSQIKSHGSRPTRILRCPYYWKCSVFLLLLCILPKSEVAWLNSKEANPSRGCLAGGFFFDIIDGPHCSCLGEYEKKKWITPCCRVHTNPRCFANYVKVSESRKQFMLPKNEQKSPTLLWYLRSNCFCSFFGKIEETINWFRDLLTFISICFCLR